MLTKYNYSLSTHFPNGINIKQLVDEIDDCISTKFHISVHGDFVDFLFTNPISIPDIFKLDDINSHHIPNNLPFYNNINTIKLDSQTIITSDIYSKVAEFNYPGTQNTNNIRQLIINSYMDIGVTNYCIRLFDVTNRLTMAEQIFTNTNPQIPISFSNITNIPKKPAFINLQVNKSGGSADLGVHMSSLTILM